MGKLTAEALLELGLKKQSLPKHVAIIMDGNGRWAKSRNLPRAMGHRAGTERLREIIRFSSDCGIEALTLYAFSTENWKRPEDEKNVLFSLLIEYFTREIEELNQNGVRISIWGDTTAFPSAVQEALNKAQDRTRGNTGLKLNIALNYGGRAEILRAAYLLCDKCRISQEAPTREAFEEGFYSAGQPELDLLIRTSGEERLSNFMLYQAAYAELYFTPVHWPDFTQAEYVKALCEYERRGRRFGGL